jgi:hypothetical protein
VIFCPHIFNNHTFFAALNLDEAIVLYDSEPAEFSISIQQESFDDVDNSFKREEENETPKIRKNFPETFIWDVIDEYEKDL